MPDPKRIGTRAAQALFGHGGREEGLAPDADDLAFMDALNGAICKTETDLHKRQGTVTKAPDRTAERYWSQFWLAVLHGEEPLTPAVVAMRRTAKERMAFETAKYVNPASGKPDMFYAVARARPAAWRGVARLRGESRRAVAFIARASCIRPGPRAGRLAVAFGR